MNVKQRNDYLISLAAAALRNADVTFAGKKGILSSYDGKVASFGVSVAMSGLKPTLAFYLAKEKDEDSKKDKSSDVVNLSKIVGVISWMINNDAQFTKPQGEDYTSAIALLNTVVPIKDVVRLSAIRKEVLDCAIALKQVVRTYNLYDHD